ncbi:hypothetical protein SDJN02_14493, partial [Cucurbita argyrosperma subsp. argyrosperma]
MATHPTRPREQDDLQDIDEAVPSNGCGCFRLFGFNRNGNYEGRSLLQQQQGWEEESWMVRKLKKLKEVSEMVGGPRWKNFIRKMGGLFRRKKQRKNRFQYDPESYALNFDDGFDGEDDDRHPPIAFSTRLRPHQSPLRKHAGKDPNPSRIAILNCQLFLDLRTRGIGSYSREFPSSAGDRPSSFLCLRSVKFVLSFVPGFSSLILLFHI